MKQRQHIPINDQYIPINDQYIPIKDHTNWKTPKLTNKHSLTSERTVYPVYHSCLLKMETGLSQLTRMNAKGTQK